MRKIKVLIILISVLLLAGCNDGEKTSASFEKEVFDQVPPENIISTEETKIESNEKTDLTNIQSKAEEDIDKKMIYKAMFKEKLKSLVSVYGIMNHQQSGEMNTWEDKWFENQGLMAYEIFDFDSDGIDEMLVCYTAEPDVTYSEEKSGKRVLMSMYEVVDGRVKEMDFMPFRGYHEKNNLNYEWTLPEELWKDEWMRVTIVPGEGEQKYILCEGTSLCNAFADGYFKAIWLLEYNGKRFDYVYSLTQNGEGSDGMDYMGYSFRDGTVASSEVLYSEYGEDYARYSEWSVAVIESLKPYGVKAKEMPEESKGIEFEDNMNCIEFFEFSNRVREYTWDPYCITYEAVMKSRMINELDELHATTNDEERNKYIANSIAKHSDLDREQDFTFVGELFSVSDVYKNKYDSIYDYHRSKGQRLSMAALGVRFMNPVETSEDVIMEEACVQHQADLSVVLPDGKKRGIDDYGGWAELSKQLEGEKIEFVFLYRGMNDEVALETGVGGNRSFHLNPMRHCICIREIKILDQETVYKLEQNINK